MSEQQAEKEICIEASLKDNAEQGRQKAERTIPVAVKLSEHPGEDYSCHQVHNINNLFSILLEVCSFKLCLSITHTHTHSYIIQQKKHFF
jgi:hypothetical protein